MFLFLFEFFDLEFSFDLRKLVKGLDPHPHAKHNKEEHTHDEKDKDKHEEKDKSIEVKIDISDIEDNKVDK